MANDDSPPTNSATSVTTETNCEDYSISPTDHAHLQLSPIQLDGTNWTAWRIAVRTALRVKKKEKFIDGTLLPPKVSNPQYDAWLCVDSLILTWLRNSITPEIYRQFIHSETARELWVDLEDSFGQTSAPSILHLKRKLVNMTQGNRTVTSYYGDFKMLWTDLKALDPYPACSSDTLKALLERDQRDMLLHFLMGLNEEFSHVCNQILLMVPLPSTSKAYGIICGAEAQKGILGVSSEGNSGFALAVSEKGPLDKGLNDKRITCSYCKKPGHTKEKCFQLANKSAFCEYCKKKGHVKANCFLLSGVVPDWYKTLGGKGRGKSVAGAAISHPESESTTNNKPITSNGSPMSDSAKTNKLLEELIKELSKANGGVSFNNPVDYVGGAFNLAGPEN